MRISDWSSDVCSSDLLAVYIQDPLVTVMVGGFVGTFPQQVRIVGEASVPQAIPYRANMTVLDVIIATGGLTEFADGNNTTLVRLDNRSEEHTSELQSLMRISYAVFCLKKKKQNTDHTKTTIKPRTYKNKTQQE